MKPNLRIGDRVVVVNLWSRYGGMQGEVEAIDDLGGFVTVRFPRGNLGTESTFFLPPEVQRLDS